MKFLKWLLIAMFVFLLLLFAIAFFLPANYSIERSVVIEAPRDEIYRSVVDLREFVEWDPWSAQDPEMEISFGDRTSGTGASYSWKSDTMGAGTLDIVDTVSLRRVNYRIYFVGQGDRPATGSFIITEAENGTPQEGPYELRWTFSGKLGYPVERYVGLMLDNMVGQSFETGLETLRQRLESAEAAEKR